MKRVLLIAYDFPPRGGTGVFRVLKFARYLPEWGWQPVVVTVDGAGPHPDPGLLAELPSDLEVLRVSAPGTGGLPDAVTPSVARGGAPAEWRARLRQWIVPDPQIAWVPGAVQAATRRLRQGDIAAMITSGPPFSTHLAGWWLKRRHPRLPWLMDMRDLWSEGAAQHALVPYKLNRMLEQCCLRHADRTTVVSDGIRDLTIRRLDAYPARISTLTNGFDPSDFFSASDRTGTHEHVPAGPLRLRYVGTIAESRAVSAQGLIAALRQLQSEGIDRRHMQVQLIGSFGASIHNAAARLINAGIVEILPFMPHARALERMREADVLLLVLMDDWEGRIAHSNKLFEYLALGRPILAVAPEGEATRLIAAQGAGLSASPSDTPAIVAALRQFMAWHVAGELSGTALDPQRLQQFHRRELASQLARLLDDLQPAAAHPAGRI